MNANPANASPRAQTPAPRSPVQPTPPPHPRSLTGKVCAAFTLAVGLMLITLVVGRKVEQTRQWIETRRQPGFAAAQRIVVESEGRRLVDRIGQLFTAWENRGRIVLVQPELGRKIGAQRNVVAVIGSGVFATLLVALAALLLGREASRRRHAQAALHLANEQLEQRIQERTPALAQANDELRVEHAERRKTETVWHRANRALRTSSDCNEALETLQATQQRLKDIIEHSTNLFYMHTSDHVLTYVSPQSRNFFDCEPAEALIRWTEYLTNHPGNALGVQSTQRAIDSGQPQPPYELQLKTRQGRLTWVEVREAPVVRDGRTVAIVGSLTNITERKRAEESMRELTAHLLQVQDEERRHLGRELHDSTSQSLAALEINLSLLNRPAERLDERTRRLLADSLELVKQSANEIRTLSYLLHPPLLDEVGLVSALRWYVEGFTGRSQIAVDLDLPSELGRFPQAVEAALFRVVQECLANIHRHSGSREAKVHLGFAARELRLTVSDKGRGIPADILQAFKGHGGRLGVGLAGMRERARQLGGSLEVASSSQGTEIAVTLPVSEPGS